MSDIDFNKIKELNQEIQKLLEERPELRKLQNEIDEYKRKVGSPANRLAFIASKMWDSFFEMNDRLIEFQTYLHSSINSIETQDKTIK